MCNKLKLILCLGVVGITNAHFNENHGEYFGQNYWPGDAAPQAGNHRRMSAPYQNDWRLRSTEKHSGEHWQSGNRQKKRDLFQLSDVLQGGISKFIGNFANANKNGEQNGDNQENIFGKIIHKGGDYLKNFLKERNLNPFNWNRNDNNNNKGDYSQWTHSDDVSQNDDYDNNYSSFDYTPVNLPEIKTENPTRPPFYFWIGAPTLPTKKPDRDQNTNWFGSGVRPTIHQRFDNDKSVPSVGTGAHNTPVPIRRDSQRQIDLIIEAQQQCGQGGTNDEYTDTSLRIARGHVASETYPWLVAIYRITPGKEREFICGGSLISIKHALSAAHCFVSLETNRYEFIVSNNRVVKPSEAEATLRKADRIVLHPGYNPQVAQANADVAFIIFQHPVEFGEFIKPICLWRGDSNIKGVVGEIGRVVGWGADENLSIADKLPMELNMNVIDYRTCILQDNTFIDIVGENSFCTGYRNGSGPCMGDSGSGFMLRQNGRWTLRGVVSLTTKLIGCDINHYIAITDVAKYIAWIESILI